MKRKIGLIDLFIDEWHANNYPAWFAADALGSAFEVALAWEEAPRGGRPLAAWCHEMGILPACSIEQVVEESDAICVLAPSNPEVHERLAELPLRSGKPVYIDKPFTTDRASAERIFQLAETHGTPLMSSSALRYASELIQWKTDKIQNSLPSFVMTRGGGNHFEEYIIHQAEIAVSLMGQGVQRARCIASGDVVQIEVAYPQERSATLIWHPELRYAVPVVSEKSTTSSLDVLSDYFPNLVSAILQFFKSGQSPIPQEETLEVISLAEIAIKATQHKGQWIQA